MYNLAVGDAIRYITLLHIFLDEGTFSTFYTRRVRRQYLLVVDTVIWILDRLQDLSIIRKKICSTL